MQRPALKKLHRTAATIAIICIACFWTASLTAELFGSHHTVLLVKTAILYAFVIFIPAIAVTGATGAKLGGKSKNTKIAAKRKRMPLIAFNGIFVLIPCAVWLYGRAKLSLFDDTFYTVQAVELVAGLINFVLMAKNMADAFAMKKHRAA